jgi:uncharacterized protein
MKNRIIIILILGLLLATGGALFIRVNGEEVLSNKEIVGNSKLNSNQELNSSSFIEQLKARKFEEKEITIEQKISSNNYYISYVFSFKSEGLKIFGMMNVPAGKGPFPVIILNHGYYPSQFQSGDGTKSMADILAREGYLTLAPDYRGHGRSESDGKSGGHRPEYSIDVLSLLASVSSLPEADESRIGMWGHSMGGEVTLRAIEATNKIKAVALWAPTSANASHNSSFYGGGRSQDEQSSEVYGISPINYLNYVSAPITLHQGLEDTEVDPKWSIDLKNALEKEGKQVEYFEYPGQDHNFINLGWDIVSGRTIDFFDKYLK